MRRRAATASRVRAISLAALATLLLCGLRSAEASAVVINFDDLAAPAPGPGGLGLIVNSQYNAQGVTFNDPQAFDYSEGPGAIPGFTHSGSVAVEPCVGAELCTQPVRATFTAAQQRVGVWVGRSGALAAPMGVRLTAFDATSGGAVVGTADATLPTNSGPTPIQTHLEVEATSATIRRLEVSVTTGGGGTAGLAVDDVEFSTAGPPPACTAAGPPQLTLFLPLPNDPNNPSKHVVQHNEFLLSARIDDGFPITGASLIAQSAAGTRTTSIYPSLVDAEPGTNDNQPIGPVRINGILTPGDNDIVLTATNCRGTTTSTVGRVTYAPIPPGTEFRQLGPVEVSQSVQTLNNGVPLIASSAAGVKRTFARVYLGLEGGAEQLTNVTGRLTAVRPDGSSPGGPLSVRSLNGIDVGAGATLTDTRKSLASSLNFELPPEWLAAGQLHLQLDRIEIDATPSTLPCEGCDNTLPGGGQAPALVRFHAVPPLRIYLVDMPYRTSPGGAPVTTSEAEIDEIASWLRRAYPTAVVQITQASLSTFPAPPGTCRQAMIRLGFWAPALGAHERTRYYGMLPDPNRTLVVTDGDGKPVGGCAETPGALGWGVSWSEETAGHEIGHMYGRKHAAGCLDAENTDSSFPYAGGLIGSSALGDAQGLDAVGATVPFSLELQRWEAGVADIMSYCDVLWMSDYTYLGILRTLCGGDLPNCPDHAILGARTSLGRRGSDSPDTDATVPEVQKPGGGGLRLSVSGTLASGTGRLRLGPVAALRGEALSDRPRESAYAIVLRGTGGRVLARYTFEPNVVGDDPTVMSIDEVVPFKPSAERIAILKGKKTLDSVRVSDNAPTVDLVSPKSKKRLDGRVKVRWRSEDADGGRSTYTLLYSHGGKNYVPIAAGLRKRSFRVDLADLPGGERARFKVIANDGVLTGSDASNAFAVPVKPPRVSISTPAEGAELAAGEVVQLIADVQDLQQTPFPGESIVWRSSIQGELGKGTAVAATLDPGVHEITATATNGGGATSAATIRVTAAAPPPVFNAVVTGP